MTLSRETRILMVVFILSLLPYIFLAGVALWPYNPLTVHEIKILNAPVTLGGEPIKYSITYTKHAAKPCRVIRQLINERNIPYTAFDSNLPVTKGPKPDCRGNTLVTSTGDLPGEYILRETFIFTYFGFWEVSVVADSKPFQMIAHHDEMKEGKQGKTGPAGPTGQTGKSGKDFWGK